MACHACQIGEDRLDLAIGTAFGGVEPAGHLLQIRLVAAIEISGDQVVLALEMIVKRALGEACLFGDGIDADAANPFSIEQLRRGIDNTFAGRAELLGHGAIYTD